MSSIQNTEVFQFNVMRLTGMQILRRLSLKPLPDSVWCAAPPPPPPPGQPAKANVPNGRAPFANELLPIIRDFIACDSRRATDDYSDWMACSTHDGVFFRLIRTGSDFAADLVIDTLAGAGRMEENLIHCIISEGWPFAKTNHNIARFYVMPNEDPKNVAGSLVIDFGNTATSFIFAGPGLPQNAEPIRVHNPFDPFDVDEVLRPMSEKQLFRSTALLLRIQENPATKPWLLLGKAAVERIQTINPNVTSLWAPKKYVRYWPEHLKNLEPKVNCQGVVGQRVRAETMLYFVKLIIEQMLALSVSAQVNPHFGSKFPEYYPQINEVLLTYPLTWRKQEKELFCTMVSDAASHLFVLPESARRQFRVHPVCSEPVAVAAYVLWNVLFQFYSLLPEGKALLKPSLASSMLGNPDGDQQVRLLIVDIGGGSSDVAVINASWNVVNDPSKGTMVKVHTQVLESLRYNRAGDRLSHIMAAAIFEYMRRKYHLAETLDFNQNATRSAFKLAYKRAAVSEISKLVDQAKVFLSNNPGKEWVLGAEEEKKLLGYLECAKGDPPAAERRPPVQMRISSEVLQAWVEQDQAAATSSAEPGLMDIFFDLHELGQNLEATGQFPHLVLLSGRTTRMPFFKQMIIKHLGIPAHRIRAIKDMLPSSIPGPDPENIDKLAVVHGAHRFKFGSPIQFIHHADVQKFRRFVGALEPETSGWRLSNKILVAPETSGKQTRTLTVAAQNMVRIGHAFRKTGVRAELIAEVENLSDQDIEVTLDFLDDYQVQLNGEQPHIRLTEHFAGGNEIMDNFCDTGKIDREPDGLLLKFVTSNAQAWLCETPR